MKKFIDSHDHVKGVKPSKGYYFYIVDWANNRKFPGKEFKSFDEAWGFLYTKFKSDQDLQEFEVVCTACEGTHKI